MVLCKHHKIVIPQDLQHCAFKWYHHYLQHPGNTRLGETLWFTVYSKGMQSSVCAYVKKCNKCQVNKQRHYKHDKLPPKLALTIPWATLYVSLINPYSLKGKDSQ